MKQIRVSLRWTFLALVALWSGLTAASLVLSNDALLLLAGVIPAFGLTATWLSYRSIRGIELQRTAPPETLSGQSFPIDVRLVNHKAGPSLFLRIEDRRLSLPGHRSTSLRFYRRLWQRGIQPLGEVQLHTTGPLGVIAFTRTFPLEDTIQVLPRPTQLHPQFTLRLEHTLSTPHPVRVAAGEEEFSSLREYRPGDSPRRVHWKSSARLPHRWMVKEFESTQGGDILMLVDTTLPDPSDLRRRLRVERMIRFAAGLVEWLLKEGFSVTLQTPTQEYHCDGLVTRFDHLLRFLSETPSLRIPPTGWIPDGRLPSFYLYTAWNPVRIAGAIMLGPREMNRFTQFGTW